MAVVGFFMVTAHHELFRQRYSGNLVAQIFFNSRCIDRGTRALVIRANKAERRALVKNYDPQIGEKQTADIGEPRAREKPGVDAAKASACRCLNGVERTGGATLLPPERSTERHQHA